MTPNFPPPHPAPWPAAPATPALQEALAWAAGHETPWPHDIAAHILRGHFEAPPDNEILGTVSPRGAPNGLITRHGRLLAAWGDTRQRDMTFSVAKSYLSICAGLAWADGLIPDLDEPVGERVRHEAFRGPRNGRVTWRHLLTNSSEWEGTLFGKSEVIDRGRNLAVEGQGKGIARPLAAPGGYWEYNDVRVNALGLALLLLVGGPLPDLFAERIMRPIGASADWRWEGYRTSWVTLPDGRRVQSVSGGGHWGGGCFIHAEDQARIGLLMLNRGRWEGREVLPAQWVEWSTAPCALNPSYGFLWWLNETGERYPSAARDTFCAVGAGGNLTWIEPSSGIVAVLRWTDPAAMDGFIGRVRTALGAA